MNAVDPKVAELLDQVWTAAVDAATSHEFRNRDGTLNEPVYGRYRDNVIANVGAQLAPADAVGA